MRVVSLMLAAFAAMSSAQSIGPGPYSVNAIQALFGASVVSQCLTACTPLGNSTSSSGCQASICCASSFIQTYRNCLECISELLDGSNSTSATKSAVDQLLLVCIQVGALPPPPSTSQDHTNHTSYTEASQTGAQLSPTKAPVTGSAVVAVPPASSVISPTSPFSSTPTSVGATPSLTNSAVGTTLGQAYSSIASVLVWAILQMM